MSTVIAIANHKGGVAKTTTAVNLAAGMAKKGFKVLLIDLDSQANATQGLGVDLESDEFDDVEKEGPLTIAHVFGPQRLSLDEVIMETPVPNLMLVPADLSLAFAAEYLQARDFRESVLKKQLVKVENFDYIVLDCPTSIGTITRNALVAANAILIPTTPTGFALRGVINLIGFIRSMKEGEEFDLRIFFSKVTSKQKPLERKARASKLLEPIRDSILKTSVAYHDDVEAAEFENDNADPLVPVILGKNWNVAARDFRALVKEVTTLWPEA